MTQTSPGDWCLVIKRTSIGEQRPAKVDSPLSMCFRGLCRLFSGRHTEQVFVCARNGRPRRFLVETKLHILLDVSIGRVGHAQAVYFGGSTTRWSEGVRELLI